MTDRRLSDAQKQVLTNAVRRLRRSADQLERMIREGDEERLTLACGMLHATETQIRWVQHQRSHADPSPSGLARACEVRG